MPLKSYYCPHCLRIKQFFLQEGDLPKACNTLVEKPTQIEGATQLVPCGNTQLLPVVNIRGIVIAGGYE